MSTPRAGRTGLAIALVSAALVAGTMVTAVPASLAQDGQACVPPGQSDRPAVPGGDAALAAAQPGPAPAGQPVRCWFAPISLNILMPDAVVAGPVVVVADGTGQAVAVLAVDGSEAWTYRVADEGTGQVHGIAASPGSIQVAGPEGLTALDPADGTRQWRYRVSSDGVLADAAGFFWPVAQGDAVYGVAFATEDDVTWDRRLVAVDVASGDARWEAPLPATMPLPPSADGVIVAVAPGDGSLLAFDAATGQQAWAADATVLGAPPVTRSAIGAGLVVAGLADGNVVALDAASGAVAWRQPVEGGAATAVSLAGSRVLVRGATTLSALDAGTGETAWSTQVQTSPPVFPFTSIPGAIDDLVVVGTTDAMDVASLIALDLATGEERWRMATEAYGGILSPLVIGGSVVAPVQDLAGSTGILSLGAPA